MNLSFAGCGFLGLYHVGVATCFRQLAPHLLKEKISGASAGALVAVSLLCDIPITGLSRALLDVALEARKYSISALHPNFNIQELLLRAVEKLLPEDAHQRVSGKIHISLTRVSDRKNVIVSEFETRKHLIDTLNASCFIPLVSGFRPPEVGGVTYIDGGFSDNLPHINEDTITVSPFCGESDICPRDYSSRIFHVHAFNTSLEVSNNNLQRLYRILFPPHPESLAQMCQQGFADALTFLSVNDLLKCARCVAEKGVFKRESSIIYNENPEIQCDDCRQYREEALLASLPDNILKVFEEASARANTGFLNRILGRRGKRFVYVVTMPYYIPCDVTYATMKKLIWNAPTILTSIAQSNFIVDL